MLAMRYIHGSWSDSQMICARDQHMLAVKQVPSNRPKSALGNNGPGPRKPSAYRGLPFQLAES